MFRSTIAGRIIEAGILGTAILMLLGSLVHAEAPYEFSWARQTGTSSDDASRSVAVDPAGSSYITGYTLGSLANPNAGSYDFFLTKYDVSGGQVWSSQLGSSSTDMGYAVAVDRIGYSYVTGYTRGSLGGASAGYEDVFLFKFDPLGHAVLSKQIGTSRDDYGYGVAADNSGNIYVTGYTYGSLAGTNAGSCDAFLVKYSSSGDMAWKRQIGGLAGDNSYAVAVDLAGNAYITGSTVNSLGGPNAGYTDLFVAKYRYSGELQWCKQFGTSGYDRGYSVVVDGAGNLYISGETGGDLGGPYAGNTDAFLAKCDSSGNLLWCRQIGSAATDVSYSVDIDHLGDAYITGYTLGDLAAVNRGGYDAFTAKYTSSGEYLWSRQLGTSGNERGYGVAVLDGLDDLRISGSTTGDLGGANAGSSDAFLARYTVPEPSCFTLLAACAGILLAAFARREKRQ